MTQPTNPDRHRFPIVTSRPDPETRHAIGAALKARGWSLNDFLVACMRLGAANPDAMLNRLNQFRPPPRVGRPPATKGRPRPPKP